MATLEEALSPIQNMYEEMLEEANKKGLGSTFKEATELFLNNLVYEDKKETIKFTPIDVDYTDGYFIFAHGDNSVIQFHIKECPGWLFGIWWNEPEKDRRQITGDFFVQYEEEIDKFKPSASSLCKDIYFTIKDKYEEGKPIELNEFDDWWVHYMVELIHYIYKYPSLAFMRDYYNYNPTYEYIDLRTAKRRFEKYKRNKELGKQLKEEWEETALNFIEERGKKWFDTEVILMDRGEGWLPRWEILLPLEDVKEKTGNQDLEWGSYYLDETEKDFKELRKIEKQYEKKTLHLPVWINNVASESVLLVPRDKFNEALKEEKGNK